MIASDELLEAADELLSATVLELLEAAMSPQVTGCKVCGCVRHVAGRCALCGVIA